MTNESSIVASEILFSFIRCIYAGIDGALAKKKKKERKRKLVSIQNSRFFCTFS